MKKISKFMLLPIVVILASSCNGNAPSTTEYFKNFTFVCHLNGGTYTTVFMNEKRISTATSDYNAYLNLNYYQGGLRIMPTVNDMNAPEGKVFAGWYFDQACSPANIVSEYAMDKMVLNYDSYERKTVDAYARWIDVGTADLVLELNNTKSKSNSSINKFADHEYVGAKFTEAFKSAHSQDCSDDVYRQNVVLNDLTEISKNPIMPKEGDVIVEDGLHLYKGCQVNQDTDWTYMSGELDDQYDDGFEIVEGGVVKATAIENTKRSIVGGQQTIFLYADYVRRQYVNIKISLFDPSIGSVGDFEYGISDYRFTKDAQSKYNNLYFNTAKHPDYGWNSPSWNNVHVQVFVDDLNDLTQQTMDSWLPVKTDFERDPGFSNQKDFNIIKWRMFYYTDDGETFKGNKADFTLENLKALDKVKYGETQLEVYPVVELIEE